MLLLLVLSLIRYYSIHDTQNTQTKTHKPSQSHNSLTRTHTHTHTYTHIHTHTHTHRHTPFDYSTPHVLSVPSHFAYCAIVAPVHAVVELVCVSET